MDNNEAIDQPSSQITELNELAKDYSRYLDANAVKQRQCFYDSIEEMLTKLEEFGGLVDMIRSDTNVCMNEAVPRIQAKCEEMKKLFHRIDQLEAFVGIVRQNMKVTEEMVVKAEQDMGSFSVKSFFSSLLSQKKPVQTKDSIPTFSALNAFNVAEYLVPELPVVQVPERLPAEQQQEAGTELVEQGTDNT